MKKCTQCQVEFQPKRTFKKYCSNTCRQANFQATIRNNNAPNNARYNEAYNEPYNARLDVITERLLAEREAVFEQRLKAMESDYQNKLMEMRLAEIEAKMKDLEKEPEPSTIAGIPTEIIAQMAMAYFSSKMNNTSDNGQKS